MLSAESTEAAAAAATPENVASPVVPIKTDPTDVVADSPVAVPAAQALEDPKQPNAVFVNVYDVILSNSWLWSVGIGVHHVGIQVYEKEYQYGRCAEGDGIDVVEPLHSPPHVFREQFFIGQTKLSEAAVAELADRYRRDPLWRGDAYNLVKHNCVDFARAFSEALLPPSDRVQQVRQQSRLTYQSPYLEEVQVDGQTYAVPVLIPPHVDRLCRYAASFLPESALRRLDNMDNPFPASPV